MSIWIMGDTHYSTGDEKKLLNLKGNINDYVIICGDSGFLWDGNERDKKVLDTVSGLGFNVLVCPGNHENYDVIEQYPVVDYCKGKAIKIRDNIHFMVYGEIYEIEGKRFWNCGGATSMDKCYRIPHLSWWPQEVPSNYVVDMAVASFENNVPDYAITHTAPMDITAQIVPFKYGDDSYMCNSFQYLMDKYPKVEWHCGHLHVDTKVRNCYVHYEEVFKVEEF